MRLERIFVCGVFILCCLVGGICFGGEDVEAGSAAERFEEALGEVDPDAGDDEMVEQMKEAMGVESDEEMFGVMLEAMRESADRIEDGAEKLARRRERLIDTYRGELAELEKILRAEEDECEKALRLVDKKRAELKETADRRGKESKSKRELARQIYALGLEVLADRIEFMLGVRQVCEDECGDAVTEWVEDRLVGLRFVYIERLGMNVTDILKADRESGDVLRESAFLPSYMTHWREVDFGEAMPELYESRRRMPKGGPGMIGLMPGGMFGGKRPIRPSVYGWAGGGANMHYCVEKGKVGQFVRDVREFCEEAGYEALEFDLCVPEMEGSADAAWIGGPGEAEAWNQFWYDDAGRVFGVSVMRSEEKGNEVRWVYLPREKVEAVMDYLRLEDGEYEVDEERMEAGDFYRLRDVTDSEWF
ncbi:hypothetical protein STSP2_00514 [Anaerohalosphaera lusitana]|uniref:Uncharacterized protein n=1 Tax=Anaerohalosphaera lusitana TaxID=1936003 RepID=A0A1U9NIG1_9BACT|nr:hypothetical protein [Anaerohalosphaera lusitana]AQT67370.1 hypothetical protein STSP2_00514 [Anaerohalosphaera lusitana]